MKDIQIRSLFRETETYAGQEIVVRGWIRTNRGSNKFGFVELNDGSYFKNCQVVLASKLRKNFWQIGFVNKLQIGSCPVKKLN